MTIIANNNVSSGNSILSLGLSAVNSADGAGLTGEFLDIISMLSQNSDPTLITNGNPEPLSNGPNIDNNFSTLQLVQNFLDEHDINAKTKMAPEIAAIVIIMEDTRLFILFRKANFCASILSI